MAGYEEKVLDALEQMVTDFEAGTAAELVLVLARRSDVYRDIPYRVGLIAVFSVLTLLLFLPVDFRPEMLLVDSLLAFALGFLAGRMLPSLTRLLTTPKRRAAQVRQAAQAVFTDRGVTLTKDRTGLLIYLSWLERRVELIADVGVERCLPAAEWNLAIRPLQSFMLHKDFPEALDKAMAPLRQALAQRLPRQADDQDEIPNRPVVL